MRPLRSLPFLTLVLSITAATASAQGIQSITFPASTPLFAAAEQGSSAARPHTREGFWFSGGLGVGSLGCEDCDEREISLGADLAIGATVNSHLLIGGGLSGWSKEEDGLTLTVATLEARVRVYPRATSGFFLVGGIGLGTVQASYDDFDENESGLGLTLGLGWDIRVGRNVSLTPYWTGTGVSTDDSDLNFGQIGLSVTIH